MTREQYNAYCKEKVRASRARKKAEQEAQGKEIKRGRPCKVKESEEVAVNQVKRKRGRPRKEKEEENKMKKYNIRFVKNSNTFTEITNVKIEDIEEWIDEKITSKEYITCIDEKADRTVVINLKNIFRVEFEEVKGDD